MTSLGAALAAGFAGGLWRGFGGWPALLNLFLALGLTGLISALLYRSRDERPAAVYWLGEILIFFLCARTAGWLLARDLFTANEMPPHLPLSQTWATWRFCVLAGAAGFACLRPGWKNPARGAICGLLFSAIGFCAYHWLVIAQAWKLLGSFTGSFLLATMPVFLMGSCALAAAGVLFADFEGYRPHVAGGVVLAWLASAMWFQHSLETNWDLGPLSLAQAAGFAPSKPANVGVLWLRPLGEQPYVVEQKTAEIDGVDASQKNLVKVYEYLDARHYHSIFVRQGLKALRQGWLFWWDAERALKAAALSQPPLVVPNYRGALDLLKGGPQTRDRLEILQALSAGAKPRTAGFEDVTQSQYIFEGFSGAFARFGNEDEARWWLIKIDNLWPIYEKKIEVTPVESTHDGQISGSVMLSSSPAAGMLVGLFYVGSSTQPANVISSGTLSDSMMADGQGRFRFDYLGPGRYYLGLMGDPADLHGPVHDSPGVFEITSDTPVAHLPPILLDR